jgi:hypothetical protein
LLHFLNKHFLKKITIINTERRKSHISNQEGMLHLKNLLILLLYLHTKCGLADFKTNQNYLRFAFTLSSRLKEFKKQYKKICIFPFMKSVSHKTLKVNLNKFYCRN